MKTTKWLATIEIINEYDPADEERDANEEEVLSCLKNALKDSELEHFVYRIVSLEKSLGR